jgi:hypothetical protein
MRAFLLLSAALFTACGGSDSNPPPTDTDDPPTPEEIAQDYDQVAQVLGGHVRSEFVVQLGAAAISKGQFPEGFSSTGDGTASGHIGTMTYDLTYHCNDGTPEHLLVACDGTANHSHVMVTASGSQAVGAMTMDSIDRTVDWEIRDLLLGKARFRGPDDVSMKSNVEGAALTVKFTATYEQVRYLPDYKIPTYGTIDWALNVERTRDGDHRVFDTNAQLTYGAQGNPTTIVFDGSVTYTINLTSGAIVKL